MKLHAAEKRRVVWTRVIARFMFINAAMAFIFSVFSQAPSRIFIISQLSRVSCYLFFLVLSRVRKNKRFYLPILSEMAEEDYWGFVALVLVVLRLVITGGVSEYGAIFQIIDMIFATIGVTSVFMTYARRGWTAKEEYMREKRIQFLVRKAKMSKQELESIKSVLIEAVRVRQKTPIIWSLVLWCISFVVGLLLNEYVSYVTGKIHNFWH
jgi:hypothetical protein